jgi:hypothetical protein
MWPNPIPEKISITTVDPGIFYAFPALPAGTALTFSYSSTLSIWTIINYNLAPLVTGSIYVPPAGIN